MENKNHCESSSILSVLSEVASSMLKLAQERIIERIEAAVNRITRNVITMFVTVFLGLVGFIFILTGFSMWLGSIFGLGLWFGLMMTGTGIFILSLIIGLTQKNK